MLEFIDELMPPETPLAFGLHPNAEIGFKLREAESFCNSLVQLQPRESSGEGGMSAEERAKLVLDEVVDKLPDIFDMEDIRSKMNPDDPNMPFVMVALQVRRGRGGGTGVRLGEKDGRGRAWRCLCRKRRIPVRYSAQWDAN